MTQIHGTCVMIDGVGVILRGPPGCGKSDLALRLIDAGARLVADDRVDLSLKEDWIVAAPPQALAGLIEVRGIGVVRLRHVPEVPVGLIVELVSPEEIERLPEATTSEVLGHRLPSFRVAPFEASAAAKLRMAVGLSEGDIVPVS
jgi:serine kinase of HPr protein (carbohydrate metabolism regulator)